jgi:hypothetical protein
MYLLPIQESNRESPVTFLRGLTTGQTYIVTATHTFTWAGPGAPPAGTPPTKMTSAVSSHVAP